MMLQETDWIALKLILHPSEHLYRTSEVRIGDRGDIIRSRQSLFARLS